MATKICVRCNQTKDISDFYKSNHYKREDGLDYYCKYCRNGASLKSFRTAKSKTCSLIDCNQAHYAKSYCRVHYTRLMRNGTVERTNEIRDLSIPIHKDRRDSQLRRTYKIDLNEFLKKASKGCEICGVIPKESLHVDHDHNCCPGPVSCGVCVRGIICHKCNIAVDKFDNGEMRPDYTNFKKIRKYVKKYA